MLTSRETDGLSLRPLAEPDARELFRVIELNRDHLGRWLHWPRQQTLEATREFVRDACDENERGLGLRLAIESEGMIAGVVGLGAIDRLNRAGRVGYWLAAEHEGKGMATRSVRSLVTHGFDDWGLHRIEIRAAVENLRSRAIPERLGFTLEGVARDALRVGERYEDAALYSVLCHDWPPGA